MFLVSIVCLVIMLLPDYGINGHLIENVITKLCVQRILNQEMKLIVTIVKIKLFFQMDHLSSSSKSSHSSKTIGRTNAHYLTSEQHIKVLHIISGTTINE